MPKKTVICLKAILLIGIGILMFSSNIRAHSPTNMVLAYDRNSQDLSVTITHTVADTNSHYIESVTVQVNSSTVVNQPYTSQPTTSIFTYNYIITAGVGDTIEVTAICSISGSITRSLVVTSGTSNTNGDPIIPGYFGLFSISLISIIIILIINYRKYRLKKHGLK